MPIELQVIRASDFVCIDTDEHLDFEESKEVLEELAAACRKRGLDRAMLDIRDVPVPEKPRFTVAELAALVGAFHAAGFSRHQRLAVLYRHDVYGGVRNFTFFSKLRGLRVQAFHDFESAMLWLWQERENLDQKHGADVPIHRREAKRRTEDLAERAHSIAGRSRNED